MKAIVLMSEKTGESLIDKTTEVCLIKSDKEFRVGKFSEVVCNDEKVLNGPGLNIPSISLSRFNFHLKKRSYPECHTSEDTSEIISEEKLYEAESLVINILRTLDQNYYSKTKVKVHIFINKVWFVD